MKKLAFSLPLLMASLLAPLYCSAVESSSIPAAATWTILGVAGGPIIHGNDAMSSHALMVGDDAYLFDIGYGAVRQLTKAGIPIRKIKAVFISHHHPDHIADLGFFLVSKWLFGGGNQIEIYGPEGTKELVDGLIKANAPTLLASFPVFGKGNNNLESLIKVTDIPGSADDPRGIYRHDKIEVSAIEVEHYQVAPSVAISSSPDAVAFRANVINDRSFVYTGDTGNTSNLAKIAKGADVLISEVIDGPGIERKLQQTMKDAPPQLVSKILDNLQKNHLAPDYIGRVASQSQVKEVVLTHFVPPLEAGTDTTPYTDGITRHFKGPIKIGKELESY